MKWARGHTTLEDMRIRKNFIAPLLLAAGVAAGTAAAPTAMAATATPAPVFPHRHTTLAGALPGNVQLNDSLGTSNIRRSIPSTRAITSAATVPTAMVALGAMAAATPIAVNDRRR